MNPRSVFSGNPRTSVFDGMGVYEVIPMHGMGAVTCQPGYMEFPEGSGVCMPTISPPGTGCAPGTYDPLHVGVCIPDPNAPGAAPPPMIPGPCPAGTFGVPPYCYAPGSTTPVPVPTPTPVPVPPVPAPPVPAPPGAPGEPSWVLPAVVGVGVIGLLALVLAGKKRATPNRRHGRRRRR